MKTYLKNNILFLLIVIQPLLDVLAYFTLNTQFSIIAFAFRATLLVVTTVYTLWTNRQNKKYLGLLFIIIGLGVAHFTTSYFTTNLNLYLDMEEFVRVIYFPLLTVNGYLYAKKVENSIDQIKKGIIANTLIIFSIILLGVVTNHIEYTYAEKIGITGWFYNKNSQSIILCFMVPFSLYYVFKKNNFFVKSIMIFIAFFLLYSNGTTGCYLMLFPTFLILIYDTIVSKDSKLDKVFNLILLLIPLTMAVVLYPYSPENAITTLANKSKEVVKNSIEENPTPNPEPSTPEPSTPTKPGKEEEKTPVETNPEEEENVDDYEGILPIHGATIKHYFDINFIKDYGYKTIDEAIGDNFDANHLVDARYKKKLTAQIIFANSNLATKLFGFEFTKVYNYGTDLETDYSSIFYYYGYIGFIFYVGFMLYFLYVLLRQFFRRPRIIFDSEYLLLGGLFLALNCATEFSGCLLRRPNASIYFVLMLIIILLKYQEVTNEKKRHE